MPDIERHSRSSEIARGADRTRRNVIKIGAIAGMALMASMSKSEQAAAQVANGCKNPVPGVQNPNCCFLKGTMIETCTGERKVEELVAGDVLPTMFGGNTQIQWISRNSFTKSDPSKPWVKDVLPVRIVRGALAPNVPHTDLFVTQAHAVFLDGALVPAGLLVNGTTITLYDADEYDRLEYYHIKLEEHDIICADGAPCETLLQVNDGSQNFAEYYRIFGVPASEPVPCAPLLSYPGGRSEIKSRLRSAFSPWIDRRKKIDVIRDRLEERGFYISVTKIMT